MKEETLDYISPLQPIDFFNLSLDVHRVDDLNKPLKKKHLLPDLSDLLPEDLFAKVFMGWHEKGLQFEVMVEKPFVESFFPEFKKGDSIELFIDTRDLKSAGFLTRFCHHFVILPRETESVLAKELTHFRTDDRHELCDPKLIKVDAEFKARKYSVKIFIPAECLHGYDLTTFKRLGFTYRINRAGGDPQHFAVSSEYLAIEKQPSLWSSIEVV